eukprot:75643_1
MLHPLITITVFLAISMTPALGAVCYDYTDVMVGNPPPGDCTGILEGSGTGQATDGPCCNPVIPGEACVACPTPAPTTPAPTTPAPTTPAPTTPAPTTPAP